MLTTQEFTLFPEESIAPWLTDAMIALPWFLGPAASLLRFNPGSGVGNVTPSGGFVANWAPGPNVGDWAVNFNGTSGAGPDDYIEHDWGAAGSGPWPTIDSNPGDGFTGFVHMRVDALPRAWASVFLLYESAFLGDAHSEVRLTTGSPFKIRLDSKIQFGVRNIETPDLDFGKWISFAWRQYADPTSTTLDFVIDGEVVTSSAGLGEVQAETGDFLAIGGPSDNSNSFRTYLDGRIAAIYTWNRKLELSDLEPLWKDYRAPFMKADSDLVFADVGAPAAPYLPEKHRQHVGHWF